MGLMTGDVLTEKKKWAPAGNRAKKAYGKGHTRQARKKYRDWLKKQRQRKGAGKIHAYKSSKGLFWRMVRTKKGLVPQKRTPDQIKSIKMRFNKIKPKMGAGGAIQIRLQKGRQKAKPPAWVQAAKTRKQGAIKKLAASTNYSQEKFVMENVHPRAYLERMVDAVVETGDASVGLAMLEVDPIYTTTPVGLMAMDVADAMSEQDDLSPAFVDVEINEGQVLAIFDKTLKGATSVAENALSEFGKVDLAVQPGDKLDGGQKSAVYIYQISPSEEVAEAYMAELEAILDEGDDFEEEEDLEEEDDYDEDDDLEEDDLEEEEDDYDEDEDDYEEDEE